MATYDYVLGYTLGANLTPLVLNQSGEVIDLALATAITFWFEKPDGTIISRVGVPRTTGTDGYALYAFLVDDIDQAGLWYYWIEVETSTQDLASHERKTFRVRA